MAASANLSHINKFSNALISCVWSDGHRRSPLYSMEINVMVVMVVMVATFTDRKQVYVYFSCIFLFWWTTVVRLIQQNKLIPNALARNNSMTLQKGFVFLMECIIVKYSCHFCYIIVFHQSGAYIWTNDNFWMNFVQNESNVYIEIWCQLNRIYLANRVQDTVYIQKRGWNCRSKFPQLVEHIMLLTISRNWGY